MNIHMLFAEIEELHSYTTSTNPSEIDNLERQLGCFLPKDLKIFYHRYDSVRLFSSEFGPMYRFVSVRDIHPTCYDIYGRYDNEVVRLKNWLTVVDVMDGNYIAIDTDSHNAGEWNFIYCFHETFAWPGESPIVAKSFAELLDRSLHNGNEQHFFLQDGFKDYGDGIPLTAENAALRIDQPKAPKKGWIVSFTLNKKNSFREFFADDDYGGKDNSFEAIRKFIDKCNREIGLDHV